MSVCTLAKCWKGGSWLARESPLGQLPTRLCMQCKPQSTAQPDAAWSVRLPACLPLLLPSSLPCVTCDTPAPPAGMPAYNNARFGSAINFLDFTAFLLARYSTVAAVRADMAGMQVRADDSRRQAD